VEKIGGIKLQGHFSSMFQFGKLGSRTFQIHFKELNDVFFGLWCPKHAQTSFMVFFTPRPFQRRRPCVNHSSYAKVIPPASQPIVLISMVREDAMESLITHAYGDKHMRNFKNIL
jgi:hypothetical protein